MFSHLQTIVGGRRMHARLIGPAAGGGLANVVMVHGLGLSGRYMEPVSLAMRHACRVWLPDLPGFGDSDKPREALDVPKLSDALTGWIEAAAVESPVLIANSFGCQIAIDAAARNPNVPRALVLQGPTTPPEERKWSSQFRAWRRNGPFNRPGMDRVSWEDYRKAGYPRIVKTFRAGLRDRPEDKLDRIGAPALVVRGEFDPICSPEWADRIAKGLPQGRMLEIPHVAHTLVWDAPGELAVVAVQFISELTRERSHPET